MTGIVLAAFVLGGAVGGEWGLALVVALSVAAWFILRRQFPSARARGAVVGTGFLLGLLVLIRATIEPSSPPIATAASVDRIEGTVVSPVKSTLERQSCDVRISRVRSGETWQPADYVVRVSLPASPRLGLGDQIGASVSMSDREDAPSDYRGYLGDHGISGSAYGYSLWIVAPGHGVRRGLLAFGGRLTDALRRAVPGDVGMLLGGLVTGDDTALSDGAREAFRVTGMSHITAVSGANLALIVTLLAGLGSWGPRRVRSAGLAVAVAGIWFYAGMTGLGPPVERAAIMATLALVAVGLGRPADFLTMSFVSAGFMAGWDPRILYDVGFQLSLAATLAIAARAAGARADSVPETMRLAIDSAIAAQLATLPILLVTFGRLSLVGVLANIVVAPLVALAFPAALGGALCALWVPSVGNAIIDVAAMPASLVLVVIERLADLTEPFAVPTLSGTAGVAVLLAAVLVLVPATGDGRRWLARRAGTARAGARRRLGRSSVDTEDAGGYRSAGPP